MSTRPFDESTVRRGQPDNAGKFASKEPTAPDGTLEHSGGEPDAELAQRERNRRFYMQEFYGPAHEELGRAEHRVFDASVRAFSAEVLERHPEATRAVFTYGETMDSDHLIFDRLEGPDGEIDLDADDYPGTMPEVSSYDHARSMLFRDEDGYGFVLDLNPPADVTDETETVAAASAHAAKLDREAGYDDTIRSALDTVMQRDPRLAERIVQLQDTDLDRLYGVISGAYDAIEDMLRE